jgi:hypothetical protein
LLARTAAGRARDEHEKTVAEDAAKSSAHTRQEFTGDPRLLRKTRSLFARERVSGRLPSRDILGSYSLRR